MASRPRLPSLPRLPGPPRLPDPRRVPRAPLVEALGRAGLAAGARPAGVAAASGRFLTGAAAAGGAAAARAVGRDATGPAPTGRDVRFADPAWEGNAGYYLLRQLYLLEGQLVRDLVGLGDLDDATRRKAAFAAELLVDAAAPTNTLLGNPAALQRAFQTGGTSVLRGLANLVHDVRRNGGWPTQVDTEALAVGRDLALTPGKVVFRNHLIEVIQYEPQTPRVFEVPLLFCPPWINKYYIMDLSPGRSLIEWAVRHGHRCFAISYRNPDASLRHATFDDYLLGGPLAAIEVVKEITGAPLVNTASVCLGGTLSTMGMAYQAATRQRSVHTATLINTHTDFSRPGVLGAFTDEVDIAAVEERMAEAGFLESSDMARTFSLIRANDLIFSYVTKGWLEGQPAPAFDLLAWNADGTRMPARLHSQFLRSCYQRNALARGELAIDGVVLDLRAVDQPTYIVSAVDDHIVPWASAYQSAHLLGGDSRFVLSTSGHIAAIVNPPSPKARHWTNASLPADHDEWLAGATKHDGTWWDDWAGWLAERAGCEVPAMACMGSTTHPVLGDAPGEYVRG
jgi:polyhydroxyalkanoate synthase